MIKVKYIIFNLLVLTLCSSCITTAAIITANNIKEHKKDKTDKKNTSVIIVTHRGQFLTSNFQLPNSNTKNITIETDNGEKLKIASKDINYIAAWYESDSLPQSVKLIYTKTKQYKSKNNPFRDEYKYNQDVWLLEYYKNDKISILVEAKKFKLRPDNYIEADNTCDYYFLKANDDLPFKITRYNWFTREAVAKYLEDCPALAKEIENKELKINNFPYPDYTVIAKRYIECNF